METSDADPEHDVVVWGATGVAGRLVAGYLADRYGPDELALALGGRNEQRLAAVEDEITARSDARESLPVVLGDATDRESLRALARKTEVVATTVGPYSRYGSPLVGACVATGTDYCDLTGEVPWMREVVDRYHDAAVDAEARVVNSCGFDAVPADLGTALVQAHAVDEHGTPCDTVRVYFEDGSGGVSGGTLASAAETFAAAARDPVARRALGNPYSLAPPGERDGVDPGAQRWPRNDRLRGEWTAPSPMAAVNERVVRRSNALLGYPYGREFRCREVVPTGRGLRGVATASAVAAGLGAFTAAMSVGPVRAALQRYAFPDPGEGPTREDAERGHFEVRVLGRGTAKDGPFTVEAEVSAPFDPGYGGTARMLGESAMCLLRDDVDSELDGGVLTPAAAIGTPLADRLRDVGFTASAGDAGDRSARAGR